jgi:hypothetical protein
MAPAHDNFHGKATVPFLCITELNVTVSNVKILGGEQECLHGEFMSPVTSDVPDIFARF